MRTKKIESGSWRLSTILRSIGYRCVKNAQNVGQHRVNHFYFLFFAFDFFVLGIGLEILRILVF